MPRWTLGVVTPGQTVHDLWGLPGGPLYACGEGGVWRSADGGDSWTQVDVGAAATFRGLSGPGEHHLFVVGHTPRGSVLLRTRDGRRWKKLKLGRRRLARSVLALGDEVYVLADRCILKSGDGGDSWREVFSGLHSLNNLWAAGPDRVLAAGYDTVRLTTDRGATWRLAPNPAEAHLQRLDGGAEGPLYGVGHWDLIRSGDRGETWTSAGYHRARLFYDLLVRAPGEIYLAGAGLYRTADGAALETIDLGRRPTLRRIIAVGDAVLAAGEDGVLVRRL